LSSEEQYQASPGRKVIFSLPATEFTYGGPYSAPEIKESDSE